MVTLNALHNKEKKKKEIKLNAKRDKAERRACACHIHNTKAPSEMTTASRKTHLSK